MQSAIREVSIVAACRSRDETRLVQQMMIACGIANYMLRADLHSAIEQTIASKPDALLLVADKDELRLRELFRIVRRPEFEGNRFLPVIVGIWHPEVAQIKLAIELGANEIFSLPATTEALSRAIYRAVFIGRPFIDVPGYFGPCRRRRQMSDYGSKDRRKVAWDYAHPSINHASAA